MQFFFKREKVQKKGEKALGFENKSKEIINPSHFKSDILEGVLQNKANGVVALGLMISLSAFMGASALVNGWALSVLQSVIDSKALAFGILNGAIVSMPGVFEVLINYCYGIGEKISATFRTKVSDFIKIRNLGRILDLPALSRRTKGSKVLESASASISEASNKYLSGLLGLSGSSVMFLAALGVLSCVSLSNAAIVLGLTMAKLSVCKMIEGKISYWQKELEELRSKSSALISDFSRNGEAIHSVSSHRKIEIYQEAIQKVKESHLKMVALEKNREKWNTINLGMDLLSVIGFSLMGLYHFDIARDIGLYAITVGASVRGMMAGSRVVRDVQNVLASLGTGVAAEKILYDNGKANVRSGEKELSKTKGHILMRGIDFSYAQEKEGALHLHPLLSNFNLEVLPGEKVALIGKSGSGKSTILSLISRKFEFQNGVYQIDGQNVKNLTEDSMVQNISSIINESEFFETQDIRYNLRHYKKDVTDEEIQEVFKKVKLESLLESEKGFEAKPDELSMGQKQRLRLASTLLYDANIVILDEVTSNLDPETKSDILENLDELFMGKTVLMATHCPEEVAKADKVIVLEKGKVIEQGPPLELLQKKESNFYHLFGKYQSVFDWEENRKNKTAQEKTRQENEQMLSKFLALEQVGLTRMPSKNLKVVCAKKNKEKKMHQQVGYFHVNEG